MKTKIIFASIITLLMVTASAQAYTAPEFDAVHCDVLNSFVDVDKQLKKVANNNPKDGNTGTPLINYYSDFGMREFFSASGGMTSDDLCFNMESVSVDPTNSGEFEWQIVLQMKPDSDIDLNIYDCVYGDNYLNGGIWRNAAQTGRHYDPWDGRFFEISRNPIITVEARPGQYHSLGFEAPFIMDARMLPSLEAIPMDEVPYTSKGFWSESIVLVRPETSSTNGNGNNQYTLKQGDMINIKVRIPQSNNVHVAYGADSILLKYVGILDQLAYTDWYCEPPIIKEDL